MGLSTHMALQRLQQDGMEGVPTRHPPLGHELVASKIFSLLPLQLEPGQKEMLQQQAGCRPLLALRLLRWWVVQNAKLLLQGVVGRSS